jgi:hypothetical protein
LNSLWDTKKYLILINTKGIQMKDQLIGKALLGILAGAMASAIKEVEQEAEQDLASHEVRIFGRELTESERTALCGLIDFDKQHGTNQAEMFKESIKYAVAQEKALQAEQAGNTNGDDHHGGLPKEVLELLSEKLGVPISDMRVVNGGELNLSDIFGLDDDEKECTHCPSYAGGEAKDHLLMKLKEHEAEAQRIRDLLNS